MSEGSRPSLESIISAPAPVWKHRYRTIFLEFVAGLPACIGLGIAFNIWRSHDHLKATAVAVLGFLLSWAGIMLLSRWKRQEMAWKRSELLSRASLHGYSEEDVVAYEDWLYQEEPDFEENPSR